MAFGRGPAGGGRGRAATWWVLTAALALAAAPSATAGEGGAGGRMPADLMVRAQAEGAVRVIVELRARPEGIAAAQEAVLQALAGAPHRITQRFTAIPFLALEASPEALRRLAALPVVLGVVEDRLHAPRGRQP